MYHLQDRYRPVSGLPLLFLAVAPRMHALVPASASDLECLLILISRSNSAQKQATRREVSSINVTNIQQVIGAYRLVVF